MVSPLQESVPPRLYGGTERVIHGLCRGLTEANIEVTVFASGDSSVEGKLVPVIPEAMRLMRNPVRDPVAHTYKMMAMVARRAHEFDLIHNHHDYWMLPLSEMVACPVLTTFHGRMDLPDLPSAVSGFARARYVSISDSQRLPMPQLPWVATIHHGLDLESFKFKEKPGKYLAFLGRIDPEKRPEWAIEIAQRAGIPLKIAAKIEGPVNQSYYDCLMKSHVDGKFIEFLGEISESEKSDFLGNALALVFPIDWPEPFGLVAIEALACGTPVLARPRGAVPELLADGITGYCHEELSKLAAYALRIPILDRKKCREWVEQRFSLRRMTEDYINVYRRLCRPHHYRRDFIYPIERAVNGNS